MNCSRCQLTFRFHISGTGEQNFTKCGKSAELMYLNWFAMFGKVLFTHSRDMKSERGPVIRRFVLSYSRVLSHALASSSGPPSAPSPFPPTEEGNCKNEKKKKKLHLQNIHLDRSWEYGHRVQDCLCWDLPFFCRMEGICARNYGGKTTKVTSTLTAYLTPNTRLTTPR